MNYSCYIQLLIEASVSSFMHSKFYGEFSILTENQKRADAHSVLNAMVYCLMAAILKRSN